MFTKFRSQLVSAIALTVLLTLGIAYVAFGAITDFQPQGSYRVTAVSATNSINTTSTTFVDVPGLVTRVTIPTGKVGDLVIEFSGEVNAADGVFARAQVDGANALPNGVSPVQLFSSININTGSSTHGFNWYKFGVGAGLHKVAIQWKGLGGSEFMSNRSMVVLASIRNP